MNPNAICSRCNFTAAQHAQVNAQCPVANPNSVNGTGYDVYPEVIYICPTIGLHSAQIFAQPFGTPA